jgi:hypothetical protein
VRNEKISLGNVSVFIFCALLQIFQPNYLYAPQAKKVFVSDTLVFMAMLLPGELVTEVTCVIDVVQP